MALRGPAKLEVGSDCSGSQVSPAVIGLVCNPGIVSFKLEHRSENSVHFLHAFRLFWVFFMLLSVYKMR